ncbi:MAG: chaperone NapD [Hyphomicrobiales bacterium]|nr:chaperone NapD [Hyphomicrobiales bacterium]MCP5373060.1 chaperone NapD [Hyphomicrobiales bacterium]
MSISGLVLHVRSDRTDAVRAEVAALPGVEVHAETGDGRLVVTVDEADNARASETLSRFSTIDGVLNTSLVYNYFEQDSDEEEEVNESL